MIGTKLAHYEITAHLGSGGMGDVYQATDLKLKRSVAIKLLPTEFSFDAERLSRFRREAQLLASLNHPNIAHIYGLEESGDKRCIVMELVEGETLQARLKRGPIPVDEALGIAKQICEALEAAHEKDVIHRDLKPGNVMLTGDGKVKVLDFGLAKAMESDTPDANLSNSPTLMSAASVPGVILGTAAYMSPEQARGRKVDKRTDIFAFGCVLFEMLTGRRAFDGEDVTEILSAVVRMEPDWSQLPADLHRDARKLLRQCLEKNVNNRRGTANDVRIDIDLALKEPASDESVVIAALPSRAGRAGWLAATVATAIALILAVMLVRSINNPPRDEKIAFTVEAPAVAFAPMFALSPDGKRLVVATSPIGPTGPLWLRTLEHPEGQAIPGTDGAFHPFWSPDGRFIGFFANLKLKKIDVSGGPPITLCDAGNNGWGGTWNRDGVILFNPGTGGPLLKVSSDGGVPVAATELDRSLQETAHLQPFFLPDGKHFLFTTRGKEPGIYVGALDSKQRELLVRSAFKSVFAAPNHLLFLRDNALMAQVFDPDRLQLQGSPFPVAVGTASVSGNGAAGFTASQTGTLAYQTGGSGGDVRLTWIDRTGKEAGQVGPPGAYTNPALSPDLKRLAVTNSDDVWVMDLERGTQSRFTFDPALDTNVIWSPDGSKIVFESNRSGAGDLYQKNSGGVGQEELLFKSDHRKTPNDWSADGRYILYTDVDPKTSSDLWVLPLTGEQKLKPQPFLQTAFIEIQGQFSPDGHWIAYASNESGAYQVYVQSFPASGTKYQVSTSSGLQPRWRKDGKELFYISPPRDFMAVEVTLKDGVFKAGAPQKLFTAPIVGVPGVRNSWDAAPDGKRFLMDVTGTADQKATITIVTNWLAGLGQPR